MITVLLADDHELFLKSLRSLLEQAEDVQIVATASNGEEAVAQACFYLPDVAVIDIAMPLVDGIEVTRQIRQGCPNTRVLILTISSSSEYVQRAVQAGASAYLIKDKAGDHLVGVIRALTPGNQVFGHPVEGPIGSSGLDEERNAWDGYTGADYFAGHP